LSDRSPTTERPITVTEGTNRLVPSTRRAIGEVEQVLKARAQGTFRPTRPKAGTAMPASA
jgi:hypothetical protein